VEQFIDLFNRLQQKTVQGIAAEALSLLMAHDWPGNIRELENVIERTFILCDEGVIGIGPAADDPELAHSFCGHFVAYSPSVDISAFPRLCFQRAVVGD